MEVRGSSPGRQSGLGVVWSKLCHTEPERAHPEVDVRNILSESKFVVRFTHSVQQAVFMLQARDGKAVEYGSLL